MSSAPEGHVVALSTRANRHCICQCGVIFLGCRPLAMYARILDHWAEVSK